MRKLIAVAAAASAVGLGACDPFNSEPGGTPHVISAFATMGGAPVDGSAPTAAGVVTIDNIPSFCAAPAVVTDPALVFVKFNKLLDGASIQTAPDNCAPATSWLTASATPAGGSWYTCYNPSAPRPEEGASVVIFWAPTPVSGTISGWDVADVLPASNTVVSSYRFTGSVKDKGGTSAPIDVTANVDPNPGAPGTPTFGAPTATSVNLSWTAAGCADAPTTEYVVQRAPDAAGVAGTYADLATLAAGTVNYTDTTVTTGTAYWYRVQSKTAGGVLGDVSSGATVTTP
jgi:hypothetical protein